MHLCHAMHALWFWFKIFQEKIILSISYGYHRLDWFFCRFSPLLQNQSHDKIWFKKIIRPRLTITATQHGRYSQSNPIRQPQLIDPLGQTRPFRHCNPGIASHREGWKILHRTKSLPPGLLLQGHRYTRTQDTRSNQCLVPWSALNCCSHKNFGNVLFINQKKTKHAPREGCSRWRDGQYEEDEKILTWLCIWKVRTGAHRFPSVCTRISEYKRRAGQTGVQALISRGSR